MPTYEYVCSKCDHQFEKVQSINDDALKVCPKELCGMKKWGKGKVKRAISAGAGLIFKGSGFYITDYRSENYKAGAKKDSGGGETKPAGDDKTTSEAKPAAATKPPAPKTEAKPAKAKPSS